MNRENLEVDLTLVSVKRKRREQSHVAIKPIENQQARGVCISKSHENLFRKPSLLSTLCGAMVCCVDFSISGRFFSFSHPAVDDVVNRFCLYRFHLPYSVSASHDSGKAVTDEVEGLNM